MTARVPPSLDLRHLVNSRSFDRVLCVAECVALVAAVSQAQALVSPPGHPTAEIAWAFPPLGVVMIYVRGGYRTQMRRFLLDDTWLVARGVSAAAMLVLAAIFVVDHGAQPGESVAAGWLLGCLFATTTRVCLIAAQRAARRRLHVREPALIVGAGRVGAHIARRLRSSPDYGLDPVGYPYADAHPGVTSAKLGLPLLGTPSDLHTAVRSTGARHVIVAFTSERDRDLLTVVRCSRAIGVDVFVVPRFFDAINARARLEHVGGMPLLNIRALDPDGPQFQLKHAMDRVVAGLLLLLLSTVLLALAATVRLTSPGPVSFRQRRVGRDGRVFDLLKFRSMRAEVGPSPPVQLRKGTAPGGVEGPDRRTKFGAFLRKSSLDELPQLINVLKGEMSLVGPRPERPEFVAVFEQGLERYGERHRVRAGMTGWAQVHGLRGQTSLADRVEWDNYYIDNWSLWLDLKIVAMTVPTVLSWRDD